MSIVGWCIYCIYFYELLHTLYATEKNRKIPSPAPFIGGVAGAILVICLVGFKPLFMILPLVIDPGSIPLVIWLIIYMVRDFGRKQ